MMRNQQRTLSPQRRAPRQMRAQVTYDAILEAAARIIEDQNPTPLTTNRIAERAGVSIGTLYGYFHNKREILVALARQILEEDRRSIAEALANAHSDRLAVLIHALFARHVKNKSLRRIAMSVHHSDGYRVEHDRNIDWFLATVRQHREFAHISDVRMMVAVQAALGIARALNDKTDDDGAQTIAEIEAETVNLVKNALAP
jgi:AcrR family transcriptional regulator